MDCLLKKKKGVLLPFCVSLLCVGFQPFFENFEKNCDVIKKKRKKKEKKKKSPN